MTTFAYVIHDADGHVLSVGRTYMTSLPYMQADIEAGQRVRIVEQMPEPGAVRWDREANAFVPIPQEPAP